MLFTKFKAISFHFFLFYFMSCFYFKRIQFTYICQLIEGLSSCAILDDFYRNRNLYSVPLRNPESLWGKSTEDIILLKAHTMKKMTDIKRQPPVPYGPIQTLLGPAAWAYGALRVWGSVYGLELLSLRDPWDQHSKWL